MELHSCKWSVLILSSPILVILLCFMVQSFKFLVSSLRNTFVFVLGKPYTYSFSPASRKFNSRLYYYVNLYFFYQANPPLTSYTNWNFVNASGSTKTYPIGSYPLTYSQFNLSFYLNSTNLYGNYSVTLTNSNGSRTETFQVLPPGKSNRI